MRWIWLLSATLVDSVSTIGVAVDVIDAEGVAVLVVVRVPVIERVTELVRVTVAVGGILVRVASPSVRSCVAVILSLIMAPAVCVNIILRVAVA
jgi:hypothetical protein